MMSVTSSGTVISFRHLLLKACLPHMPC